MEIKVRSAKIEEFESATELINKVFRISRNEKPTMIKEFPLLINKKNIENMIVIYKDGKVVTDVNYLIQDVLIQGKNIKVASIGGVCTDPDYEGLGYASKVLDFVEKKMLNDGVDILSVSGTRTLYTRRKCSLVKSFYKYTVENPQISVNKRTQIISKDDIYSINNDFKIQMREYIEEDIDKYIQLYSLRSTRFLRTKKQFKTLLNSATIAWGHFSYKRFTILKENEIIGYIVLRIINEEIKYGKVIELSLDKIYIATTLIKICEIFDLDHINHYVHIKDFNNQFEGYDKKELENQGGTLKVINFEKLMKSLNLYFNQYIEDELLESLLFRESDDKYIIEYKNLITKEVEEEFIIEDIDNLNKFLFEYNESNYEEINHLQNIQKFARNSLPIDFVWTENLNYQ